MSDAFNVAAHIPMARDAFERWLASPAVVPSTQEGWDAMYRGWYWAHVKPPNPPASVRGETVRVVLANRARQAPTKTMFTLVRHADDHLIVFDMAMIGPVHQHSVETLALVRQTAPLLAPGTKTHVLYWADAGGHLPTASGVLALCEITPQGSRFITENELPARDGLKRALANLAPASTLLGEFAKDVSEDSQPRPSVYISPSYLDPAILQA